VFLNKLRHLEYEIIVVDNGSTDDTVKVVRQLLSRFPVRLVTINKKGLSLAAFIGIKNSKGEIVGVMDADLSHPPEKIPALIKPIIDNEADFVIGSRSNYYGSADIPLVRQFLSKVAMSLVRPFTDVKDPLSGFFFFRKRNFSEEYFYKGGFKICLELITKGRFTKIKEVQINLTPRKKGRSKLSFVACIHYFYQIIMLTTMKIYEKLRI
jgi:dolichol-phosphate mannosyltransferase